MASHRSTPFFRFSIMMLPELFILYVCPFPVDPTMNWKILKNYFDSNGRIKFISMHECPDIDVSPSKVYFSKYLDYSRQIKGNVFTNKPRLNPFWSSALVRECSTFWHLKGGFVSSGFPPATKEYIVSPWHSYDKNWRGVQPMPISTNQYENVVCCFTQWSSVFGHLICDILPLLMQVPESVMNKSVILGTFNKETFTQYIEILGINTSKIVWSDKEWTFAKNIYSVTNIEPILGSFSHGIPCFRNKIFQALNLDQIVPTQYILTNRPYYLSRHVHNMKDLCDALIKKYPDYPWKQVDFKGMSVKDTIRYYAATKLFITAGGSNSFNIVFMQNGTSHFAIMGTAFEQGAVALAAIGGIWVLEYSNPWSHHGGRGGKININENIKSIEILLYAMKNGCWPKQINAKPVFNLTEAIKRLSFYPYSELIKELQFNY